MIVLLHYQFVQFRSVLLFPIEQPEFQRSHVIALAFALNQTIICEAIQVIFPDLPCQFCVLFGIRLLSEDFRRLREELRAVEEISSSGFRSALCEIVFQLYSVVYIRFAPFAPVESLLYDIFSERILSEKIFQFLL